MKYVKEVLNQIDLCSLDSWYKNEIEKKIRVRATREIDKNEEIVSIILNYNCGMINKLYLINNDKIIIRHFYRP